MYNEFFKNLKLSSCSITVNGVCLETELLGYKTSYVKGRESIETDINEISIGYTDGSRYRRKKNKTKELEVGFYIVADSIKELNELANRLKFLLSFENSKIVFEDENDKYWIGNISKIDMEKVSASNAYCKSGTFTIHLSDPYKYSINPISCNNYDNTNVIEFNIDYKGTKETPISITIDFLNKYAVDYLKIIIDSGFPNLKTYLINDNSSHNGICLSLPSGRELTDVGYDYDTLKIDEEGNAEMTSWKGNSEHVTSAMDAVDIGSELLTINPNYSYNKLRLEAYKRVGQSYMLTNNIKGAKISVSYKERWL